MAKYLVDSKARIDPSWYRLADEIVKGAPPEPHMEIPQLWNMRGNSRIKLKNGRLIDMVTGLVGLERWACCVHAMWAELVCQVARASSRPFMAVSRILIARYCILRFEW